MNIVKILFAIVNENISCCVFEDTRILRLSDWFVSAIIPFGVSVKQMECIHCSNPLKWIIYRYRMSYSHSFFLGFTMVRGSGLTAKFCHLPYRKSFRSLCPL